MHDIKLIRDNPTAFDAGLAARGLDPLSASLLELDDTRRRVIGELQLMQERRNAASKEIGATMGRKDMAAADALKAEVGALKERMTAAETAQREADAAIKAALETIPNIPADDVPKGADEHGNVEYRRHGSTPTANHLGAQHFEIGEAMRLMDFEAAAKMSGSRFVVLKGQLARLERAIGQFMIDLHTTEHGYTEVAVPLLVKEHAVYGVAQLPKFENDLFKASYVDFDRFWFDYDAARLDDERMIHKQRIAGGNISEGEIQQLWFKRQIEWRNKYVSEFYERKLYLTSTAEVTLTNLVRESVLTEEELPLRFTALTPCFRSEAGAAGRDTRGMLRQHQFTKCELVSITTPEASKDEHERMLVSAENVLKKLGLHYRVMTLCTGDMGFAAQKTYDIEAWLPGQGTYREISSCSVCGDFQARRMDARYRPAGGKPPRYVHTLNGSGLAVGRTLIAVMENYLNPDGSVSVPDVLLPYMGGLTRVEGVK
jgi:seryl-tRNA synthetase